MLKKYKQYIIESKSKSKSKTEKNIDNLKKLYLENGFTIIDIEDLSKEKYFNDIQWFDDNTLKVYRSLALPENQFQEFLNSIKNGIGRYWSFNKNIDAIWGNNVEYQKNKNEKIIYIRCIGKLKLSDIDFDDCLYAFNDDFYSFTIEKEIRGKKGGDTIKVVDYKIF